MICECIECRHRKKLLKDVLRREDEMREIMKEIDYEKLKTEIKEMFEERKKELQEEINYFKKGVCE